MLTIHLRISDAATKQPVPCRLRVSDAAGNYFAPLGRLAVFACGVGEDVGGSVRLGRDNFAHIDGQCEIALPAGVPLRIQAFRGPEWTPLDTTITLKPGQMAVRLEMTRWFDRVAEGLTSEDSRCHFLSPHAALMEAAAEDVDTVHLLARVHYALSAIDGNTYPQLPGITTFSGQAPALAADGRTVFVNTLNTHRTLGNLGLLNSHRPVYPLAFGGSEGPDDWSLCDWADQCHRKGGRVVWCDPFREGLPGGEALVALVLVKIDAIEFDAKPRTTPFLPWVYRLWSAGLLVPLVGSSGKDSNRGVVGAVRSYSPLSPGGEGLGVRGNAGTSAVVAKQPTEVKDDSGKVIGKFVPLTPNPSPPGERGALFVTNGPLLRFAVTGTRITASAESVTPFDKLEIVANGQVIASAPATVGGRHTATVEVEHTAQGWIAARAVGGVGSVFFPDQPAFAHTSPVVIGSPSPDPAAVTALRKLLDHTREWVETQAEFTQEKRKEQHLERVAAAIAKLGGVSP
jgi:hypothetical protein